MANKTITRPENPDKTFFLSIGWYVLFYPASDPTTNLLEGWKITGFNKDANAADNLETTHQQSDLPWKEFITTMIDAGNLTVPAMYDATLEMPMTGGISQARTTGTMGKVMIAFRDAAATASQAIVVFECDAALSSWGGIDATNIGQIITSPFTFKLSGEPLYDQVEKIAEAAMNQTAQAMMQGDSAEAVLEAVQQQKQKQKMEA